MTFDMNDAEPQKSGDLIPDGTFAKVTMTIRPGGVDGESEIDRGLLKRSGAPGSDVLMLDCEFTVSEGTHARRRFWQTLTTSGGKLDESGVSIGAKITKSTLRAMIDSALGLDPEDMSEVTKAKRILRGFADLSGITFVAKIRVEASNNAAYSDKNKLDHVVLPTAPEWRQIMNGESVPARPSTRRQPAAVAATSAPAWGTPQSTPARPATPAWAQGTAGKPAETRKLAAAGGPAWLMRTWPHASGAALQIARLAIDTGYEASAVYAWSRRQGFAQVAPVKGVEGFNRASPVSGPTYVDATEGGKRIRRGARLWTVAVSTFKAETYRFLRLERPTAEELAVGASFPPGTVHLPDWVDDEWLKQFVAEQLVTVKTRRGFARLEWQKLRERNEALDTRVYARAAAWIAGLDRWSEDRWAEAEREVAVERAPAARSKRATAQQHTAASSPDAWLGRRRGWLK